MGKTPIDSWVNMVGDLEYRHQLILDKMKEYEWEVGEMPRTEWFELRHAADKLNGAIRSLEYMRQRFGI